MAHEKGQGTPFSWLGAVDLATFMWERVISQLQGLVSFALGTRNLPHAYRIERAPSVGGLLHWEHCGSARAFPSGIGATWPPTAILLAALLLAPPRYWWMYLAWGGSCPPARRRQFSASRSAICSDALPGRQQHLSCRACRSCPPIFDRRSASARQLSQYGRIHPSSGSGDSRRERGGSLAIPAHWLGRRLLARVASAGPRKRVLHHHDPSCYRFGVRRSVGWGARHPEILFGTRSHHGGCACRGYPSLWPGVTRTLDSCPPCCWLLCRF